MKQLLYGSKNLISNSTSVETNEFNVDIDQCRHTFLIIFVSKNIIKRN